MGSVKLLKASAGSGKTFRLVYEYVRSAMEDPSRYRHILAVTFTNKATAEMKRRIIEEVSALADGVGSAYAGMLADDLHLGRDETVRRARVVRTLILHDYSRFAVVTIDKFFQRIIRSFIRELGIDPGFNLELSTEPLLSQAADMLIDGSGSDERLRRWMTAYAEENIGQGRKWNIKEGLVRLGSQIFMEHFRAEGSQGDKVTSDELVKDLISKTEALSGKLMAQARQALDIINSAGLSVSDFLHGRNGCANYFNKIASGNFELPGKRVEDAIASDEKWCKADSPDIDKIKSLIPSLRPLLYDITRGVADNTVFFNSVAAIRRNYRNFAVLGDLVRKVAEICREQGIMPIAETNDILNRLVSGNDTPFIFEKTGNYFTRYMMDEFQDTSRLQWENFVPLLRNSLAQSTGSPLLIVGDVKQSIYRWRGGDWSILARGVGEEFKDVAESGLTTNYRSLPNIVNFNNSAVSACVGKDNALLDNALEAAQTSGSITDDTYVKLRGMLSRAYEDHSQQSVKAGEGYVTVELVGKDAQGEITPPVVARVEELQERGYAPGDIAVLVRTGAQGKAVADMLLERKKASPGSPYSYDVVTQEALLINSSPAVRFMVACFRLSVSDTDKLAMAVADNYLGKASGGSLTEDSKDFLSGLRLMPPQEAFEAVSAHYRLHQSKNYAVYLQALHEQILDFTVRTSGDVDLFVKWWEEEGDGKSVNLPRDNSAITVITIHKAKGLQYKAVIIPWCDWRLDPKPDSVFWASDRSGQLAWLGRMPVNFNKTLASSLFADDYWEERVLSHIDNVNLFYVAVTRAEEELHIMMPEPLSVLKEEPSRIGELLLSGIDVSGENAVIGDLPGRVISPECYPLRVGFGTPGIVRKSIDEDAADDTRVAVHYISFDTKDRLRLRMPSTRYAADGACLDVAAPRDYGILMHRVFEGARMAQDIAATLKAMVADGVISAGEEEQLRSHVSLALDQPLVSAWFDGSWEEVRNENEIILPHSFQTRRPDRVMVRGDHAVVVDYKFGLNRPASHRRQVEYYVDLLERMGYARVEGYLWYFSLGEIVPVTACAL